jgi:hypothetical protein
VATGRKDAGNHQQWNGAHVQRQSGQVKEDYDGNGIHGSQPEGD